MGQCFQHANLELVEADYKMDVVWLQLPEFVVVFFHKQTSNVETSVHKFYCGDVHTEIYFVCRHFRHRELDILLLESEFVRICFYVLIYASGFKEAVVRVFYFLSGQWFQYLLKCEELLGLFKRGMKRGHR